MTSDNVLCTICLEPINIINKENLRSIKYISPIVDEIENVSSDIEDSSPHQVDLSPVVSFDISTSESPDSESISPSIQQTYIDTPELQTIIELEKDYINPCECKNPIHIKCFLDWLSYKNTTTCEICNSQYTLDIDIYNEYIRNMNNEYDIENNNNNNNSDYSDDEIDINRINTDRLMYTCVDYLVIFIKYSFVCMVIILMIFLMVLLLY